MRHTQRIFLCQTHHSHQIRVFFVCFMNYILCIYCRVILMLTSLCSETFISPTLLLSAETILPYFLFVWYHNTLASTAGWVSYPVCCTARVSSNQTIKINQQIPSLRKETIGTRLNLVLFSLIL